MWYSIAVIKSTATRNKMGGKKRSKRVMNPALQRLVDEMNEVSDDTCGSNSSNSSSVLVSSQVDDCQEEMRFLWLDHASNQKREDGQSSSSQSEHLKFGGNITKTGLTKHGDRHQVNYGATKYIKP